MTEVLKFLSDILKENVPYLWELVKDINNMMEIPPIKWVSMIGTATAIICAIIGFAKHGKIKM